MHANPLIRRFPYRLAAPPPKRVLVVEDDEELRHAEAEIIRSLGCEVEIARDGEQALLKLAFQPFDLLVTDWQMPRLDGGSLVLWLRATHHCIPVIMITGANPAKGMPAAVRRELSALLSKPVSTGHLAATIRETLGLSTAAESDADAAGDEAIA